MNTFFSSWKIFKQPSLQDGILNAYLNPDPQKLMNADPDPDQ